MKRLFAVAAALLLCGALAACGGQEEPSGAESLISAASAQEESSQPGLQPEPRAAEESSAGEEAVEESPQEEAPGALVLIQKDSGAEAGYEPTFTLYPEGTFELSATFYDGTATITGTYVEEGDSYVLTPGESTAQGVVGSDVGQMTLTAGEEGYAYSGGQLGLTYDGAVFSPSQG